MLQVGWLCPPAIASSPPAGQSKNNKSTPRAYPSRADLPIKKVGNMKMEVAKLTSTI